MVARQAHNLEVACSSLASATKQRPKQLINSVSDVFLFPIFALRAQLKGLIQNLFTIFSSHQKSVCLKVRRPQYDVYHDRSTTSMTTAVHIIRRPPQHHPLSVKSYTIVAIKSLISSQRFCANAKPIFAERCQSFTARAASSATPCPRQ